jgi:hypothetical protein
MVNAAKPKEVYSAEPFAMTRHQNLVLLSRNEADEVFAAVSIAEAIWLLE